LFNIGENNAERTMSSLVQIMLSRAYERENVTPNHQASAAVNYWMGFIIQKFVA
jgi:hypothetical protein